eukprot:scaffold76726_cov56-Phaeocystis_antarctica.AAC.2
MVLRGLSGLGGDGGGGTGGGGGGGEVGGCDGGMSGGGGAGGLYFTSTSDRCNAPALPGCGWSTSAPEGSLLAGGDVCVACRAPTWLNKCSTTSIGRALGAKRC